MTEELRQTLTAAGLRAEDIDLYSSLLHQHGYDTDRLIQGLSTEDLEAIGITKRAHVTAVLSSILRLRRSKITKRHVFYISHDKMDAGTEASMLVDTAALRFPDKLAFVDSDHKHFRSFEDFRNSLLASNFCLVLLTPRYLHQARCLAELVWAHQTDVPICLVQVDRVGLDKVDTSVYLTRSCKDTLASLSTTEWSKVNKMGITVEQVHDAIRYALQRDDPPLVFRPHESRESRAGFFQMLWRFLGELAAFEAGTSIFSVDQRVDVRWRRGERWYSGRVTYIAPNGTYDIAYDDGDRESAVTSDFMQAHRRPPITIFKIDDRIEGRWKGRNAYFPGRIVAADITLNTYDIIYDDGDIEYHISYELIRRG